MFTSRQTVYLFAAQKLIQQGLVGLCTSLIHRMGVKADDPSAHSSMGGPELSSLHKCNDSNVSQCSLPYVILSVLRKYAKSV